MSTLDDWVQRACAALDLRPDSLPIDLRNDLLDLTRDVAHGVTRVAGPVTTYLAGVAVGRGEPPGTAIASLRAAMAEMPPAEGPDIAGKDDSGKDGGGNNETGKGDRS
jgi:hypothetical protein